MAKYFSPAHIKRLEPSIQNCVSTLMRRLGEHRLDGKVVDLSNAYRCLSSDVITEYAFPRSRFTLESPDFDAGVHRALRNSTYIAIWHRHIPIIFPILRDWPRWIIAKLDPGPSLTVFDHQQVRNFLI